MSNKLIIDFPNTKLRDAFIGRICDEFESSFLHETEEDYSNSFDFDYSKAIRQHGWNRRGTPIIKITEVKE